MIALTVAGPAITPILIILMVVILAVAVKEAVRK